MSQKQFLVDEKNTTVTTLALRLLETKGEDTVSYFGEDCEKLFEAENNGAKQKVNKIFANYPFGIKSTKEAEAFIERTSYDVPKSQSLDWLYNLSLLESLTDKGRAIGIMTCGACFNSSDKKMRQFFVENGYIEAVIALPSRIFAETNTPTAMIVLSKNNSAIRMIDATEICNKGRRQSEFSEEHIMEIVSAMDNDTKYSRLVPASDLEEGGYNLDPAKSLQSIAAIKNGIMFDDVIRNITRGAQISADMLDQITSNEPTSYQYLMLRDIQDGIINESLPFLKDIELRLKKYCISPGNLVISKNGAPFKVAVMNETGSNTILANGNLYVIELDETKIRPYYLLAFFESQTGVKILNNIAVGTAMPILQIEALKSLVIPCPPMEEQRKIERRYLQTIETVRELKNRLKIALEDARSIFEF